MAAYGLDSSERKDVLLRKYCFSVVWLLALFLSAASAQQPDPIPTTDEAASTVPKADKRLFGVLPNYRTVDASIPFSPLTNRQKLNIARHDSFDWPTFVLAGVLTFVSTGDEERAYYGTGLSGFANRYLRSAADQISGNMLTEGLLPMLLNQDPRYFRPGTGSFRSRLGSALSQIVVARNDSGHRTFNAAEFLGNAMAVGIANTYSPHLNSWSSRTQKFILMLSTDTFSNVIKEFGPDIRERLFGRRDKSSH
jgi:hypothetical protein